MPELAAERCEACTGATPRVTGAELDAMRAQLSRDWRVEDGVRLRREYTFKTFAAAFGRATAIAGIAEEEGHHPDLCVGWAYLDVTLTTHAINGLSRNDFIMAAKIDQLDR
jgi:4a-hydroxytetrahydrobiopterin dehydratase